MSERDKSSNRLIDFYDLCYLVQYSRKWEFGVYQQTRTSDDQHQKRTGCGGSRRHLHSVSVATVKTCKDSILVRNLLDAKPFFVCGVDSWVGRFAPVLTYLGLWISPTRLKTRHGSWPTQNVKPWWCVCRTVISSSIASSGKRSPWWCKIVQQRWRHQADAMGAQCEKSRNVHTLTSIAVLCKLRALECVSSFPILWRQESYHEGSFVR